MLLLNVVLALAWMVLTSEFTPYNLVIGFVIGYLMLGLAQRRAGSASYFVKVPQVISFFFFFVWELIIANVRVAISVLSPTRSLHPGVVSIPLDIKTDAQITLLANIITLTPGTLSLDVSTDRSTLFVHALHVDDIEEFRQQIKDGFERRILEVFA
ncbi:MAG: Na+/H+ antiporter subunit E [Chloroflexota bacterium]